MIKLQTLCVSLENNFVDFNLALPFLGQIALKLMPLLINGVMKICFSLNSFFKQENYTGTGNFAFNGPGSYGISDISYIWLML